VLTCENFLFLENIEMRLEATNFTDMATGHKRFSVVEELSSPAFCKTVATVSPIRAYPELPELSENPPSSYINKCKITNW
jgi:hypothetical protein